MESEISGFNELVTSARKRSITRAQFKDMGFEERGFDFDSIAALDGDARTLSYDDLLELASFDNDGGDISSYDLSFAKLRYQTQQLIKEIKTESLRNDYQSDFDSIMASRGDFDLLDRLFRINNMVIRELKS